MVTSDFKIKLIDFGFALALSGRKGTGYMKSKLGTPMYMAPEIQDKTVPYQGTDADIFALGVTLFVARVMAYPWKKPDIISDARYILFAGDNGIDADDFWAKFRN